ncbi:MAG: prepilin-type N-terminal cleavage/methylation domain-containing protein [Desulfobacterales bacterium]
MRIACNDKGFNLIEVLVAMVILSVGLMGTASLVIGIIRANHMSKQISMATTIAQDQMESVIQAGYEAAADGETDLSADYTGFTAMTTEVVDDTPSTNMKTVSVSVSWATGTQPVILSTILAK